MNNQVLLYGPDTFRLHQAVVEVRKRYTEKYGADTEIVNLDGGEVSSSTLESHIFALPLFALKRMIILRGALAAKNQPIIDILTNKKFTLPSSTLLIIYEPTDLRQTKMLAPLFSNSTVKYYPLLNDLEIKKYISRYVMKKNGSIDSPSQDFLVGNWGSNLWALTNELNKLLSYSAAIDGASINKLVSPSKPAVIFDIIDNVLSGDPQKALLTADRLRFHGEPVVLLISLLAGAYKNMISISLCLKENITSISQIAAVLGLHPFVIRKTLPVSRLVPLTKLIETYKNFTAIDADIKRGIIEEDIGLDLLIIKLCEA